MNKVLGDCLGAVLELMVGGVLAVGLLWVLAQANDLHGAPLELVALVLCLIGESCSACCSRRRSR